MKANDVTVKGDAGQVVAGNVVHEGAPAANHLHNVITIHGAANPAPIPTITELQRKRIAVKVKEVMRVAGIKQQFDVYSVVLTDFGVEKILDLPRDQFKGVMAMLDNWIAEEAQEQTPQRAPERRESRAQACATCVALLGQVEKSRRWLAILTAVYLLAFFAYTVAQQSRPAVRTEAECRHDGRGHSVGSVIRMPDDGIYECVASDLDRATQWRSVSQPSGGNKRREG